MTRRNILSTSMPGSVRCFASAVAKVWRELLAATSRSTQDRRGFSKGILAERRANTLSDKTGQGARFCRKARADLSSLYAVPLLFSRHRVPLGHSALRAGWWMAGRAFLRSSGSGSCFARRFGRFGRFGSKRNIGGGRDCEYGNQDPD